ncbi:acyltransferase [Methanobrevibacter millerae]|uniref:Acetyltransferase (Isoleucine patch superfamily) n=1 Tax=Methanobrevibacter millerae TaxID=230361 RepID=A0A1G5WUE8_9EURY|nr:DapH/DapD/GlmU-related protein [Methanobrevibacter millerae]SDA61753.1 Acetyltransferase (isoleucine patch superfamily) [Methanobrevibacter millerae]
METVSNRDEISSLNDNKINGNPKMERSKITFAGKNNILFCENNVNLVNCNIVFKGNDSLIYLSSCKGNYSLNMQVVHDSVIYIGKNNDLIPPINLNVQEHQNLIIGEDCSIGSNTNIRTGDAHIIYDEESKARFNKGSSVIIGDHVWLGHQIYVDKGVIIGSGSVIENNSYIASNSILKSNSIYQGNPAKLIKENVFFTKDYVANFTKEDSRTFDTYSSRVFLYDVVDGETLDIKKVDGLLSRFDVNEKLDFVQKLFIQNKRHNRFSI